MTGRTYKIRKVSNGYAPNPSGKEKDLRKIINRYFTVPKEVADRVPEDDEFLCEMVEEGILYRRVEVDARKPPLPSWAVGGEDNGKGTSTKPKSARPRPAKAAGAKRKRPSRTKT